MGGAPSEPKDRWEVGNQEHRRGTVGNPGILWGVLGPKGSQGPMGGAP